ncbi:MAG: F0F1 ATP synthase subunit B [Planctomycetota bacterium]
MVIQIFTRAVLAAILLIAVAPALAAGEDAEPSIFAGSLGNALVTFIIFMLVILILGRFAWKPLLRVLHDREQAIRDSLESAKHEREQAEKLLADYQAQLDKAREDASALVDEGRRDAEVVRQRLQAEARQQAAEILGRAKREIKLATDTAIKELYDQTAELSVKVAAGIIGKELSLADHRDLVAEALEKMKDSGPSDLN